MFFFLNKHVENFWKEARKVIREGVELYYSWAAIFNFQLKSVRLLLHFTRMPTVFPKSLERLEPGFS